MQWKIERPVQFESIEQTREAVHAWIIKHALQDTGYLFPSRVHDCPHLSTPQYARILKQLVASIALDPLKYGTHSLRRTKAALIHKKTWNLRAVQLLLGHTRLERTIRHHGIEVGDAVCGECQWMGELRYFSGQKGLC